MGCGYAKRQGRQIMPVLLRHDPGPALPAVGVDIDQARNDRFAGAFGLIGRHSNTGPDGTVMHAEMEFMDGVVMMGSPGGEYQNPKNLGQSTSSLYVYVDDLEAHCARARAAGAEIIEEPADQPWADGGSELC